MKNETILVVGGSGYIGSHMVKDLLDAGHDVITLDDLSTGHRDLLPGGTFVEGDLGDKEILDRLFSSHSISAVMHFAAFSIVGESVENPLKYYRNNLAATTALLSAMIRHDVKRFIFSSTAAVYGEPVEIPITENHPCNPTNPYGATKIAVERMLHDCDSSYGLKYISLRYFNASGADESGTIGERHTQETHLIPLVLKVATGEREDISIFGTDYPTPDGTCIRDYINVSDLTQAHLLALKALLSGGESAVYNLGNNQGQDSNSSKPASGSDRYHAGFYTNYSICIICIRFHDNSRVLNSFIVHVFNLTLILTLKYDYRTRSGNRVYFYLRNL